MEKSGWSAFDPPRDNEQKCRRKASHSISLGNIVSWRRKVKERPFRAVLVLLSHRALALVAES